jgi:hypothetical protein
MAFDKERSAFGPEALSRFTHILDEVSGDLIGDGVPAELVRSNEMRTRLAQRLLGFARFWWTDTQIKQLLLRKLRNERSASRIPASVATVGLSAEPSTDGWMAVRSAYLGVDQSQAIWRKSVPASKVDRD